MNEPQKWHCDCAVTILISLGVLIGIEDIHLSTTSDEVMMMFHTMLEFARSRSVSIRSQRPNKETRGMLLMININTDSLDVGVCRRSEDGTVT